MNTVIMLLTSGVPHLVWTVLLAMLLSLVVAMLNGRSRRERVYHAGYMFLSCVASVMAGSWIMYLVHR